MNIPHYPSERVKKAGEDLSQALVEALLHRCMGGLGGCKEYDPSNFPEDMMPYIKRYVEEKSNDSVALIYAYMRAKELE